MKRARHPACGSLVLLGVLLAAATTATPLLASASADSPACGELKMFECKGTHGCVYSRAAVPRCQNVSAPNRVHPGCPSALAFMVGAKQGRAMCACPDGWGLACEGGCSANCNVYGFKQRCFKEFDPRARACGAGADNCCSGGAVPRRGRLCPSAPAPPSPDAGAADGNRFVFVMSSGHCGTSFLGHGHTWSRHYAPADLAGMVIAHETEADPKRLQHVPWAGDFCAAAASYVAEVKFPDMAKRLAALPERAGGRVWFETGHQVSLGILPALRRAAGGRAKFVRLRRARLGVAYSFAHTAKDGPCGKGCVYCLCPTDAAARCPVPGRVWAALSVFQQFLWLIDEVEEQWRQFMAQDPATPSFELNWGRQLELPQLEALGRFVGLGRNFTIPGTAKVGDSVGLGRNFAIPGAAKVSDSSILNDHLHGGSAVNATWGRAQDTAYRSAVGAHSCDEFACACAVTPVNATSAKS